MGKRQPTKKQAQKKQAQKKGRPQAKRTDWAKITMEIWLGLFVAFYLLFPGGKGYRAISAAKTWSFYGLMALLLGLGIWYFVRDLRNKTLRPLTAPQIAALGFLVCTLVSAALSAYPDKAWYNPSAHEAALTVSLYVLLFLIVSRWGRATERLFRVLCWSLGAFCLLCLLQAFGENPLGLYPGDMNYYDGYNVKYPGGYAGTIGNVDFVSAFLALVTPMLLLRTLGQKPKQAWPCWVLAAICFGLAVWIRVLCGLVGLALGAVICLAVLCRDRDRKWILLGIGALALAGLTLLWAVDLPVKFLHELHELLHGRPDDTFGTGRFYIWRQMLERIPRQLFFGVGPDAARFSGLEPFIRYEDGVEVARATITDAHCYPLHILYCQGLPALLSWLALVGMTLFRWFKARTDPAIRPLGGGLVCFLCAMFFCPSSIIIMPFFWLTMALIEAAANRDKGQVTADK